MAPTGIETAQRCRRLWAFRKIGKRYLVTPGTHEGKHGHNHVEGYCGEGIVPESDDASAWAAWMQVVSHLGCQEYEAAEYVLQHPGPARDVYDRWSRAYMGRVVHDVIGALPVARPGVEVEQVVKIDTGAPGWYYSGRFDVMVDRARIVDPKFYSKSSMQQFAHTQETLRVDPQAIIYSAWAEAPIVEFTMLYIVKPPRKPDPGALAKAAPVTVQLTQEEIDRALDAYDQLAEELVYYLTHCTHPNEVPHDADRACGGVGEGCDHKHECALW